MSEQVVVLAATCRRQQDDRRQANLRSIFYALFMSRRQTQRRCTLQADCYSDRYDVYTFGVALLLNLLCVFDSYFTLQLTQHGATELNPILEWTLQQHVLLFFILKYTVTAVCVVLIVMHRNFRVFGLTGFQILFACLCAYGILVNYQLSMLGSILF